MCDLLSVGLGRAQAGSGWSDGNGAAHIRITALAHTKDACAIRFMLANIFDDVRVHSGRTTSRNPTLARLKSFVRTSAVSKRLEREQEDRVAAANKLTLFQSSGRIVSGLSLTSLFANRIVMLSAALPWSTQLCICQLRQDHWPSRTTDLPCIKHFIRGGGGLTIIGFPIWSSFSTSPPPFL